MKKGAIVILLLAVALAGCQASTKGISGSSTPFIGGTEGLRVSLTENAPPAETLDFDAEAAKKSSNLNAGKSEFDIILRIENVGEYKIPEKGITATIGGIFAEDFGYTRDKFKSTLEGSLSGVQKAPDGTKIVGGINQIEFRKLYFTKTLEGNRETPIQADVCYRYQTKATGEFCMRQNTLQETSGVCTIKGPKPVFNSGGPIQVSGFEESVAGTNKVLLKFTVKALNGNFYSVDSKDPPCTSSFSDESVVKVTVDTGLAELSCTGGKGFTTSGTRSSGDVRLTNGEAVVTCFQGGVNVDAIKTANIYIDYNHKVTVSTKMLIRHIPSDGTAPATGQQVVSQTSQTSGQSSGPPQLPAQGTQARVI